MLQQQGEEDAKQGWSNYTALIDTAFDSELGRQIAIKQYHTHHTIMEGVLVDI